MGTAVFGRLCETTEARALWWAWFKGRVRAREKKTYLLKVGTEEK